MSDTLTRVRSWWQQLAAIMIKEGKQVTRDPSSWIIAVVLPLTFLFLFGFGISLDHNFGAGAHACQKRRKVLRCFSLRHANRRLAHRPQL